jgi:hypothetical protein
MRVKIFRFFFEHYKKTLKKRYTGCGLWGWSSCEVQCTNYWYNYIICFFYLIPFTERIFVVVFRMETRYHIEQYTVYQKSECPQVQITCCIDYFFVLGHCLRMYSHSYSIVADFDTVLIYRFN